MTENAAQSRLNFAFVTRHLNRSGYSCLQALVAEGIEPSLVIVSDQRPSLCVWWRRHLTIAIYRLKCWYYRCRPLRALDSEELFANRHGIPVRSFDSLKNPEFHNVIATMDLDLLVVAGGWHEKIPVSVLNTPTYGSINVHPSLLPEFRGTSITRWQVLEGVRKTGVSIHRMDGDFDSGDVVAQTAIELPFAMTPQELFQRLANVGASLLLHVLTEMREGGGKLKTIVRKVDSPYVRYYSKWQWGEKSLLIDAEKSFLSIYYQLMASTQESYDFPGPELRINCDLFVIRGVRICARRIGDTELSSDGCVAMLEGDYIRCERLGEEMALLITQIQPCSPRFYLRRADIPGRWFQRGQLIELSIP